MSPLEEATTEELLKELGKRFPHCVFAGRHVTSDPKHEKGSVAVSGSPIMALGLVQQLNMAVQHYLVAGYTEPRGDDAHVPGE